MKEQAAVFGGERRLGSINGGVWISESKGGIGRMRQGLFSISPAFLCWVPQIRYPSETPISETKSQLNRETAASLVVVLVELP